MLDGISGPRFKPTPPAPVSETPCAVRSSAAGHPPSSEFNAGKTSAAAPVQLDPAQAIKLVKNGKFQIEMPLPEGGLPGIPLTVKKGTTVKLEGEVKDGKVNFDKTNVTFHPMLDGPLWMDVRGVKVSKEGQVSFDIQGAPDLQLTQKFPSDLSGLVNTVQGLTAKGKVGVGVWGIHLADVSAPPIGPKQVSDLMAKGGAGMAALNGAKISIQDAELNEGKLSLGSAGEVDVGPGSKFNISGTGTDLTLQGRANVKNVAINTAGVQLQGASGSTDLNLHLTRAEDGTNTLKTQLSNLNVDTQYAVSRRPNGDFIKLANGHINNGNLRLEESFKLGEDFTPTDLKTHLSAVSLQDFSGTLEGARLTVPDRDGTAQVQLGRSTVAGNVDISADHIAFHGQVDAKARLKDFQGGLGPAFVDVKQADIQGSGKLDLDTRGQFSLTDGNFGVKADVTKAGLDGSGLGLPLQAGVGADVNARVSGVNFSPQTGLQVDRSKLDVNLKSAGIGPSTPATSGGREDLGMLSIARKLQQALSDFEGLTGSTETPAAPSIEAAPTSVEGTLTSPDLS